jgi:hypothetical protein
MSHIAFDTLKFAETLKAAGLPEEQAKAIVGAQAAALSEALDNTLATKLDIARVEAEITLMKWMLGFVLAGVAALVIKTFF